MTTERMTESSRKGKIELMTRDATAIRNLIHEIQDIAYHTAKHLERRGQAKESEEAYLIRGEYADMRLANNKILRILERYKDA